MTALPLRAVIYARQSSDLQNPLSVRDQIASCRKLARRHGWQTIGSHVDEAMSGTDTHRPGFQQLRDELQNVSVASGRNPLALIAVAPVRRAIFSNNAVLPPPGSANTTATPNPAKNSCSETFLSP